MRNRLLVVCSVDYPQFSDVRLVNTIPGIIDGGSGRTS